MLTDIQKMALRDVFRQTGLAESRIEDIFLLLRFKPDKVQQAFYCIGIGHTFEETGEIVGVSTMQAWNYVKKNCTDIKQYLEIIAK